MADKKLFKQAEIAQYDEIERRQYESTLKEYWDYTSTLDTAAANASNRMAKKIAKKLRAMGLSIEQIAEGTGLSLEEIEAL